MAEILDDKTFEKLDILDQYKTKADNEAVAVWEGNFHVRLFCIAQCMIPDQRNSPSGVGKIDDQALCWPMRHESRLLFIGTGLVRFPHVKAAQDIFLSWVNHCTPCIAWCSCLSPGKLNTHSFLCPFPHSILHSSLKQMQPKFLKYMYLQAYEINQLWIFHHNNVVSYITTSSVPVHALVEAISTCTFLLLRYVIS